VAPDATVPLIEPEPVSIDRPDGSPAAEKMKVSPSGSLADTPAEYASPWARVASEGMAVIVGGRLASVTVHTKVSESTPGGA
jgi:hypothetical protein